MEFLISFTRLLQENASLVLLLCLAALYTAYYLFSVVRRPEIACGDKGLRKFIDEHCAISREKFWPTWWCIESHVQTLIRILLQSSSAINYTKEYLKTPDGGEIRLDWEEAETSQYPKDTRPTILMLPGLTGSSKENYMLNLVQHAKELGYRSVVFNNRGTGDTSLKTPRTYCAADTEDIKLVVNHIKEKYPEAPLTGVGISLGGIILVNYLASVGSETEIIAALIISPAYDLHESRMSLDRPLNYWLFNRHLANNLCDMVKRNLHLFEKLIDIDTDHVLKSRTIRDYDDRLTSKIFGFESAEHYYTTASIHTKVHTLSKPVLCLSAADDPFAPEYSIPTKNAEQNKNIAIVKTSHGGHIGFLEGIFPSRRGYMHRWFEQFISAVFKHGIKTE